MVQRRRVGQCVAVVFLFVSILGLFAYLSGPQQSDASLSTFAEREILVEACGNYTLCLLAFESAELIEYHVANLHEYLINRTICVELEAQRGQEIWFHLMNSTQFENWKDESTTHDITFQNFTDISISYSPENPWSSYYLVLQNRGIINATVKEVRRQLFLVRVFDYQTSFRWLEMAFLAAVVSFAFQLSFGVSPSHLWEKIEHSVIPVRYQNYIPGGRSINIGITIGLVGATITLGLVGFLTGLQYDRTFMFINQLWKDYLYRGFLGILFILVLLLSVFMLAFLVWQLTHGPVLAKYFPTPRALEEKRKNDEDFTGLCIKYLLNRWSLLFYLCIGVCWYLVLEAHIGILQMFIVMFTPFCIFLGFIATFVEFKIQERSPEAAYKSLDKDFEYNKIGLASGLLISLLFFYVFQFVVSISEPVSGFIIDNGVLVSHSNQSGLWNTIQIFEIVGQITSVVAYLIPLFGLIIYYSLMLFTVVPAYLPKTTKPNGIYRQKASLIFRNSLSDLAFFFVAFICSLWLKSLIVSIDYDQILVSLAASFMATSFKSYLEVFKK